MEFRYPLNVQIEITSSCNFKCKHCYNYWRHDNEILSSISQNKLFKILDILIEQGVFEIVFTGGEPFLKKELVFKAIDYCITNGINVSVNSTLFPLKERDFARLKSLNCGILFSFPSYKKELFEEIIGGKKSFERIIQNIKIAKKYDISLSANIVVTPYNYDHIEKTAIYLHENLGINNIAGTPFTMPNYLDKSGQAKLMLSSSQYSAYLKSAFNINKNKNIQFNSLICLPYCSFPEKYQNVEGIKRSCSAGDSTFTISPNGDIRACSQSHLIEGNIFENQEKLWERLVSWRNGEYLPDKCNDCSVKNLCKGGCRIHALNTSGSIDSLDPRCGKFSPKTKSISNRHLQMDISLMVNKDCKIRQESVDKYIIYSNSNVLVADPEMLNLLNIISSNDISGNDLIENHNVDKVLIDHLYNQGLITEYANYSR